MTSPPPEDWLIAVNRQSLAVRLVATTVHDVNNLLQVMSGAAEVLALDPSPAAVAKRTTSIVSQSAAATAVLQGLVAFVRADAQPAADGAPVLAVAQQVLASRQHAFRKLRVSASAEGDEVDCAMARHRLQQVLLNLVINAEQALTGHAAGTLRIGVRNGEAVTVTVTDNGAGLSDARQASAFAWPPSPGAGHGALGLGLRVSRALVEAAHGRLTIEAPPDGGTRVVVTVPR